MRICKSPFVRMSTHTWLPAEEVRRDTSHLVTVFQIKLKCVRVKFKHGTGSFQKYTQFPLISHRALYCILHKFTTDPHVLIAAETLYPRQCQGSCAPSKETDLTGKEVEQIHILALCNQSCRSVPIASELLPSVEA